MIKKIFLLLTLNFSFVYASEFSYEVFFNKSPYNNNLDLELINIITQAKSSIDCHFYDIERTNIVNAFIYAATNNNVKIRILTDSDYYNSFCSNLNSYSNIKVYNDEKTNMKISGSRESHNKFAVFDFNYYGVSAVKNFVWTGSYNITDNGTYANANNVILIKDPSTNLAAQYIKEFREMWGVDDNPAYEFNFNADGTSKFGSAKEDNTRHIISLGTGENNVEVYFAPSDSVESNIINTLKTADYNIYFCIFTFTSDPIREIMTNKYFQGVKVRGVFDAWQKTVSGGEYSTFTNLHIPVYSDNLSGLLHHKYIIIDYGHPDSDPTVITGSFNWTYSANTDNDENTLIIHNASIASQYFNEFKARYEEAGGIINDTYFTYATETPKILNNYITPYTEERNITILCPSDENIIIKIYSESGRFLKKIESNFNSKIYWYLDDENGIKLNSGLYFLKLIQNNFSIIEKVLIIR